MTLSGKKTEERAEKTMRGVLKKDYHTKRLKTLNYKYRLNRRSYEAIASIKEFHREPINKILDLGSADGLMLCQIKKYFSTAECYGIEYSQELIDCNHDKQIKIIKGDVQELPFPDNAFDVVIAAAIIEHVASPEKMMQEAFRVLKKGGIMIITTPYPLFEKIATAAGFLNKDHNKVFYIEELKKMLKANNFTHLSSKRFMFSPIGFPGELQIERLLIKARLECLLLNQIIVGKK